MARKTATRARKRPMNKEGTRKKQASQEKARVVHSRIDPAISRHEAELSEITNRLQKVFKKHSAIVSVYIYGSLGTARAHQKSDIDMFIIVKDHRDPVKIVNALVSDVKALNLGRGLDFDICFESEAKHFLHRGSAQSQYLTIGRTGKLIHGKPVLEKIPFDFREFYLSIASLSQKIRHEVVNQFGEYGPHHFRKDLLFRIGSLAYEKSERRKQHPIDNVKFVLRQYPSLRKHRDVIFSDHPSLEQQWEVAETLRKIVERKMKR